MMRIWLVCGLLLLVALPAQAGLVPGFYPGWEKYQHKAAPASHGAAFTDPTTGMPFVLVKGGCFEMGSPASEKNHQSDESPVHQVCVDSFYMAKYDVTNAEYRKYQPGHDSGSYKGHSLNGDRQPVVEVSWNDAQGFIDWLNRKSGKNYRLPTEAEWEYAARAGTSTARYWGDDPGLNQACRYANVNDLTSKRVNNFGWNHFNCDDGYAVTSPVGSFAPNAYGLYDMLGNVWQWCSDWYSKGYYSQSPRDNPQGPSGGSNRVNRGGSWDYNPGGVRAAFRLNFDPGFRDDFLGFRLVFPAR